MRRIAGRHVRFDDRPLRSLKKIEKRRRDPARHKRTVERERPIAKRHPRDDEKQRPTIAELLRHPAGKKRGRDIRPVQRQREGEVRNIVEPVNPREHEIDPVPDRAVRKTRKRRHDKHRRRQKGRPQAERARASRASRASGAPDAPRVRIHIHALLAHTPHASAQFEPRSRVHQSDERIQCPDGRRTIAMTPPGRSTTAEPSINDRSTMVQQLA